MLKGAHLSERKCREILNLFCEDLTATQIAAISNVSRVTVNAYLKMIRLRLAQFCDDAFPLHHLPLNHLSLKHGEGAGLPKTTYYGFTRWNGLVFSTGLSDMSREHLQHWQKHHPGEGDTGAAPLYSGDPLASGHQALSIAMPGIHAIADFSNWRLYRRDAANGQASKYISDEISGFWGLTRSRLMKFRGLNRNTLYLHIKECEFRYNHRNEDMQHKILIMISRQPLQDLVAAS